MAAKQGSSVGRKVASVALVSLGLLAVVGGVTAWKAAHLDRGQFCTAAASIGEPGAPTPEAAFAAWWDEQHPDGPLMDEADIDRDGTTWHVDKGGDAWQKVEVGRVRTSLGGVDQGVSDPDDWTVTSANRCSYADA